MRVSLRFMVYNNHPCPQALFLELGHKPQATIYIIHLVPMPSFLGLYYLQGMGEGDRPVVTNNGCIADAEADAENWLKEDSKSPEPVEKQSTV